MEFSILFVKVDAVKLRFVFAIQPNTGSIAVDNTDSGFCYFANEIFYIVAFAKVGLRQFPLWWGDRGDCEAALSSSQTNSTAGRWKFAIEQPLVFSSILQFTAGIGRAVAFTLIILPSLQVKQPSQQAIFGVGVPFSGWANPANSACILPCSWQ